MKKINMHITEKQDRCLIAQSSELGLSKAELIRRILDEYFEARYGFSKNIDKKNTGGISQNED